VGDEVVRYATLGRRFDKSVTLGASAGVKINLELKLDIIVGTRDQTHSKE
jgi:hypothetical protein